MEWESGRYGWATAGLLVPITSRGSTLQHWMNWARGIQEELTWVALYVGVSRPRGVSAPTAVAPITLQHALCRESASVLATITRTWTRGGEGREKGVVAVAKGLYSRLITYHTGTHYLRFKVMVMVAMMIPPSLTSRHCSKYISPPRSIDFKNTYIACIIRLGTWHGNVKIEYFWQSFVLTNSVKFILKPGWKTQL